MNINKSISDIRNHLSQELEGGLFEPVAAERLMHYSRELRNVAIHVFAKDLTEAFPSKASSIRWTGWYGEDEQGAPGHYVDEIEIIFIINGMAHSLPVFKDFFDWDSADFGLISYLSDIQVSNISDAEKAIGVLNDVDCKVINMSPELVEDFCKLAFIHSHIEEWPLIKQ